MQSRWSSPTLLLGIQIMQALRQSRAVSCKVKYMLTVWPNWRPLDIYSSEMKTYFHMKIGSQMLTAALFITLNWKEHSLSITECINKTVVHPGSPLSWWTQHHRWILSAFCKWKKPAKGRAYCVVPATWHLLWLFVKLKEL